MSSCIESHRQAGPGALPDAMFLTWERHRRTRGLAARLGLRLHEIEIPGPRLRRYGRQFVQTLRQLYRERPAIVFVQNPSLVLSVLVLSWRRVTRSKCVIVMDAHNEAVEPYIHTSRIVRALAHWAIRMADFTIVTNGFLANKVVTLGGSPLLLPDPMPEVSAAPQSSLNQGDLFRVLVIATYAKDEPIASILEAAKQLVGEVEFAFTGNFRKLAPSVVAGAPPNVRFLGYLQEDEYWNKMREAHAVLDLTLMEDCLVCGAYEAVAIGRPLILSDTRALREYFRQGALYCSPQPEAIRAALRQIQEDYPRLKFEISALRPILEAEWSAQADAVASAVSKVAYK